VHQVRSTTGALQHLQGQVSSEVEGASKLRAAQLEARERLLTETEQRLRESQRRSEEECVRLQAMLQALEGTVKEQREQVPGVGQVCVCVRVCGGGGGGGVTLDLSPAWPYSPTRGLLRRAAHTQLAARRHRRCCVTHASTMLHPWGADCGVGVGAPPHHLPSAV
jgi:hypothetical protein